MLQHAATPFSRLLSRRMCERVERMENDRAGMPAQQNVVTAIPIGTHPVSLVLVQCHYLFSKSVFGEFPAAILRFSVCGLAVVALVFQSGKIVVNGVRTDMQIVYVMHLVYDMLKNAGALHPSSFVCVITVSNRVFTGRTANVVNLERLRTLMSSIDYQPDNLPLASAYVAPLVLETGVTDALRRLYVFYFGHTFQKGELPVCLLMTTRAASLRKHFRNSAPVAARCNKWTSSSSSSSGGGKSGSGHDSGGGKRRKAEGGGRKRKRTAITGADQPDEFREDGGATWLPTRTYNIRGKTPKVVIPASGIINILNCSNTDDAQCVYWYMLRILDSVHMHRDEAVLPSRRFDHRATQRRATLGQTLRVAPIAPQHVLDAARAAAERTPAPVAHWTTAPSLARPAATPATPAAMGAPAAPATAMGRTMEFRPDNTVQMTPWVEPATRVSEQREYATVQSSVGGSDRQQRARRH